MRKPRTSITMLCWLAVALVPWLVGCDARAPPDTLVSRAGLVRLPCTDRGPLRAAHPRYCADAGRHWMTPLGRDVVVAAAQRLVHRHPGAPVLYMDASWPQGRQPMPPHLSHGDGRQVDLALFYTAADGTPLPRPPTAAGFGAFEPPRPGEPRPCTNDERPGAYPDPPTDRRWRLDEAHTRALIATLLEDPRVLRILVEPHLKQRLGFAREPRLRFPGCHAMRHDSHLHVEVVREHAAVERSHAAIEGTPPLPH